ncbi:hypothetical protein JCM11641_007918 [Rhodosporidiobolus odoratus]
MRSLTAALRSLSCLSRRSTFAMSTRSRSASLSSVSTDEPAAKRQRLEATASANGSNEQVTDKVDGKRRNMLPYGKGMHLAPMVRIGTLPVRLLALEYGAELVWGPEIVDKAIIGAQRVVNEKTGVISYMKNNRSIFETHPVEKPRLVFQLGSASPELAVQALKVIEADVAGVGLNCGCPKAFSLQGGMGAALLKEPERLCAILRALVGATDLPIDAKIRLLPLPPPDSTSTSATSTATTPSSSSTISSSTAITAPPFPSALTPTSAPLDTPTLPISPLSTEPTLPLVSQILSTGIANLTVHCRTQIMRSTEPALWERMREITRMGEERGIPVVCNGDALGGGEEGIWGNFAEIREKTGVTSVMIARAAEANPSCFSRKGLEDPIKVVIPRLLKIAIATSNHFSNTKYILNAMNLHSSPTPPGRELNRDMKQKMNKARTYEDMCAAFDIGAEEVAEMRESEVEELVPEWMVRKKEIEMAEKE